MFREGELVVVTADAVRAVIEVKTTLDSAQLCSSLDLMAELGDLRPDGPPVFKGVFGFGGAGGDTLAKTVGRYYRGEVGPDGIEYKFPNDEQQIVFLTDAVTAVCIRGAVLFEIAFGRPDDSACLRPLVREIRSSLDRPTQMAEFLERLLAHLREPIDGPRTAPWLYDLISVEQTFGAETYIYDHCDWGPYANGEPGTAFEHRLIAYRKWLAGRSFQIERGV